MIKLEDGKTYFYRDLRRYLKELGLPSSKPAIISYEKKGLIVSRRANFGMPGMEYRIYTAQEIRDIGEKLKGTIDA